jgi:hypothetical protein
VLRAWDGLSPSVRKSAQVWDVGSELRFTLLQHAGLGPQASFIADGTLLVTGAARRIGVGQSGGRFVRHPIS